MSSNIEKSSTQVSIPYCMLCSKYNPSVSYCATCSKYLCYVCDVAHKMKKSYNLHSVKSLAEQNMEDDKASTDESLRNMLKYSHQLQTRLNELEEQCRKQIIHIDSQYLKKEELLKKDAKNTITSLNILYKLFQTDIGKQCQELNGNLLEIEARGYDWSRLFNILSVDFAQLNGVLETSMSNGGIAGEFDILRGTSILRKYLSPIALSGSPVEPKTPGLQIPSEPISSLYRSNNVKSATLCRIIGSDGCEPGYFKAPRGLCLGGDGDFVVADTDNNRIQVFDAIGRYKFTFRTAANPGHAVFHPRKIAYLPKHKQYVVADEGNFGSRMQLFSSWGFFVKKLSIKHVKIISGIAITENEEIVFVDSERHSIFITDSTESFHSSLDCSAFVNEPSDIAALGELLYVCDFKGHSVAVMNRDGVFLKKFGMGSTVFPSGIDVSPDGFVYVIDAHGNHPHIGVYTQDGGLVSEFRCNDVKVSRCSVLKITSEGRIFTVDKSHNNVLILEALDFSN